MGEENELESSDDESDLEDEDHSKNVKDKIQIKAEPTEQVHDDPFKTTVPYWKEIERTYVGKCLLTGVENLEELENQSDI